MSFQIDDGEHYDKTEREIFDKSNLNVYYKMNFLLDSTQANKYTEAQTVLMVSDNYTLFNDYYRIMLDSINDLCAESKKNAKKYTNEWDSISSKRCYSMKNVVLTDLKTSESTVQISYIRKYQYTTKLEFNWHLENKDTIINNLPCKKATCRYAGRDYIAWYTEKISLPYGPYLFRGLPGLIVSIYDTKNNYIFTCNGIEKPSSLRDIYLYADKHLIRTTREKALTSYKNEWENYASILIDSGDLVVVKEGPSTEALKKRRPSNMLELEW